MKVAGERKEERRKEGKKGEKRERKKKEKCYVFMVKSILVAVGTEVPMSGTETPVLRTCTLSEGPVSFK